MTARGASAIETLVALVLGLTLLAMSFSGLSTLRRTVASGVRTGAMLDAVRVTRSVIGHDVRAPAAEATVSADTIAMRVYRGWAIRCRSANGSAYRGQLVAYRGIRAPDPRKDSVRVLSAGRWQVVDMVDRVALGDCEGVPGARAEAWHTEPLVPDGLFYQVFERGSYHIHRGAVRYRPPRGVRQPITPPVVAPLSEFVSARRGVSVTLVPEDAPHQAWSISLGTGGSN